MATTPKDDPQLSLKLSILKKAVLEEREKSANLLNDNKILQTELTTQKETISKLQEEIDKTTNDNKVSTEEIESQKEKISKLQEEINQLRDNSGNKQIKRFFNTFFEEEEEDQSTNEKAKEDQINSLKEEIGDLQEQISSIQKEKNFINAKLNEKIKEYEELKNDHKSQIDKVHQHYEERESFKVDDVSRIESMSGVIRKLEREKIELEKTIETYDKDKKQKIIEIQILFKEQNQLLIEMENLKCELTEVKKDNMDLRRKVDLLTPITTKTIFKGTRIINNKPKKTSLIELSFGEIEGNLIIKDENNGKIIDLKYIDTMKKVDNNKIEFNIKISGSKEHYLIEFPQHYISHILKFYQEASVKDDTLDDIMIKYSVGDCFV